MSKEIKIKGKTFSEETIEKALKAYIEDFDVPEDYKDGDLSVHLDTTDTDEPIVIDTEGDGCERVWRNVKDTEKLIEVLQSYVDYCKEHDLGV